jgi:hypothetical protein
MFPLLDGVQGEPDYLTLDDALAGGTGFRDRGARRRQCEQPEGHQPQPNVAVLIVDGEELVGAKQNRVVNLTILVPAQQTVVIPVTCVEQGRWHHVSQ